LLAILVLQQRTDSHQLDPDVEECLNDQSDVVVGDHPVSVADDGWSRKMAVSG
jgi:hypothetical protein